MDGNLDVLQGIVIRCSAGKISMKISEVTKTIELKPIEIIGLNVPNRDCKIKVSFLREIGIENNYFLFVIENDLFSLKRNGAVENIEIFCGSQSLLWETIKGKSEDDLFEKLKKDIELILPVNKGEQMIQFEVVKILEIDTVKDESKDSLRTRIEILKEFGVDEKYTTRTYSLKYFNLQPTFPLSEDYESTSVSLYVSDDSSEFAEIKGKSVEEIVEKILYIQSNHAV